MVWHFRLGYAVFTLLLFRLVWGIVGGKWSRFASFHLRAQAPSSTTSKGKDEPLHAVGHNPLGALSVFAMLVFLLAQVATGLISDDEIAASGPLDQVCLQCHGETGVQLPRDCGQTLHHRSWCCSRDGDCVLPV